MEVASPLPYQPVGSKRSFACSPAATTMDVSSDDFSQQQFKRRRFENSSASPFPNQYNFTSPGTSLQHNKNAFIGNASKRSRTEISANNSHATSSLIEEQASEIERLKTENSKLISSLNEVKSAHDKAVHENTLLKRMVTKQHERTTQAQSELDAAKKYKQETDESMSKMEQMILQLRYHLQAQESHANNFMGYRPPDVY
uniref:Uncharacterized protein n=1 Tax=Thalassionema nitzschioides TaxID=33649 RepID=A0A7S1E6P2_9STRA|mmetsp:Transcript_12738/g.19723  ORF Transcript_12738/g.19723 Transcript_12738/m.19723 type:complete len:200 (+) Transcript_12738:85-684(+)